MEKNKFEIDSELLNQVLMKVEKPSRYIGNELNMVEKDKTAVDIRVAFAFPDVYEVGMSHIGMKILYHLINKRSDSYCERVFSPWPDMEKQMRELGMPIFALETKDSLKCFDFVAFTLQYELTYTNVLNILNLAGIPLTWEERDDNDPLIIAGGPCAFNPEPLADFLDVVVIGEGEEVVNELFDCFLKHKRLNSSKLAFLREAAQIEGIYVPRFYSPSYKDNGSVEKYTVSYPDIPRRVKKRIIEDINNAFYPDTMIVPFMEIVHDRIPLEIFRGCGRGCRFCQAGIIYRPVRERSAESLVDAAESLIRNTGYEEISFVSLSSSDYSQFGKLLPEINELIKDKNITLSLPSMRIDSFGTEIEFDFSSFKKSGVTLAPEAGTQRLRDVINKGVTTEDLRMSVSKAFDMNISSVKLYFMIGLPTEDSDDLEGIVSAIKTIRSCYYENKKGKNAAALRITVSLSSFVPKAFTPFQWFGQDTIEELERKQRFLAGKIRIKGVTFNWHDPRTSYIEAVLARGDRKLRKLLLNAWHKGCKLDGWSEHFRFEAWINAFKDTDIDPSFYANRQRDLDEILPWEIIDSGVKREYLLEEYNKAVSGITTPDCGSSCSLCGISESVKGLC